MFTDFCAHELKPPPLPEIELEGCEEYETSLPVVQGQH
jgi:hypothetical protein